MRYREILQEEGMKDYLQMFNGFPPQAMKSIKATINAATSAFRRPDRIIWYLRYYRIAEAGALMARGIEFSDKQKKKLVSAVSKTDSFDETLEKANSVVSHFETFKHFIDLKIMDIEKEVWNKQEPAELLSSMHVAEKKWQENLKNSIIHNEDGDEHMVLDCGNGWAWFDLNTYYCKKEAAAMGHCGNAGGNSSETILSLRKHVEGNRWSPRATFIVEDGIIGEMKGRFNEKPEAKYHPQIMPFSNTI